jgi:plasmid stabilization system protein ParE
MAKVRYSPQASADLQEIHGYIASNLGSPKAASNTVSRIAKKVRTLEGLPDIGSPLSSIVSVTTDYRFLVSGSYLVFYRFVPDPDSQNRTEGAAYIIRVRYGGRNYLSVLFDKHTGGRRQ